MQMCSSLKTSNRDISFSIEAQRIFLEFQNKRNNLNTRRENYNQGFIQPPTNPRSPQSKIIENTHPSPAELPLPKPTPKNFGVPEVPKMIKVLEDGRENG